MARTVEDVESKEKAFITSEPNWMARAAQAVGQWFVRKLQATAQFYRDVKQEMKRVTWPTREDVYAQTVIVIIVVFFFGFFLYGTNMVLSYLANKLFEYIER